MQWRVCRPDRVGEDLGAAVVEQDQVELLAGRRPGATPVQNDVYGFIRSAVLDRGRELEEDLHVLPGRARPSRCP